MGTKRIGSKQWPGAYSFCASLHEINASKLLLQKHCNNQYLVVCLYWALAIEPAFVIVARPVRQLQGFQHSSAPHLHCGLSVVLCSSQASFLGGILHV